MTTAVREPLAFARDVLGLELHPRQKEALEAIACHVLDVLAVGRRGGKSLIGSAWAAYDAVVRDLSRYLRPGELRYIVMMAPSLRQSRELFRTLHGFFERPELAPLVVSETNDTIELVTGVIIMVIPCNSRSARRLPISTVILEEFGQFIDSDGYQSDEAVYRALAPSTAQFLDDGRIVILSTPRGTRGAFYRLFKQAGERPDGFSMHLPTWEMNPTLTKEALQLLEPDDMVFEQEFAASFTAIGGGFIPTSLVLRQTGIPEHPHGRRISDDERAMHGRRTLALDPAFDGDDFGLALSCVPVDDEGRPTDTVYLEWVDAMRKPGFEAAMDRVAELVKEWAVEQVVTDQMAQRAVVEGLSRRGVTCRQVPWTGRAKDGKSKHSRYGKFKTLLGQGMLWLVDDAELRQEIVDITVEPAAVDPGYSISTHGPDDRIDAAVMAVTEATSGGANVRFLPLAGESIEDLEPGWVNVG